MQCGYTAVQGEIMPSEVFAKKTKALIAGEKMMKNDKKGLRKWNYE